MRAWWGFLPEFPKIRQTFNLVPSMVLQIDEYADGTASDPFFDCAVMPAEDFTEAQRAFMLKYFFQANVPRMINGNPRYRELYERRQDWLGAFPLRICATCRC